MNVPWGQVPSLPGLAADWMQRDQQRREVDSVNESNQRMTDQNIALQREFAQHGIRWKVEDAQKAGIHPLAALGAQTHSFSPVGVGTMADTSSSDFTAKMGQNFRGAATAMMNKQEIEFNEIMNVEKLKNAQLQNKLLETQVVRASRDVGRGPGLPSNSGLPDSLTGSGQGDAYVLESPLKRVHSAKGLPHQEVGHVADVGWAKTKTGLAPIPSSDVKERIEDNVIQETLHAIRNNLLPSLGFADPPSRELLPKGAAAWKWDVHHQEYRAVYPGRRSNFDQKMVDKYPMLREIGW